MSETREAYVERLVSGALTGIEAVDPHVNCGDLISAAATLLRRAIQVATKAGVKSSVVRPVLEALWMDLEDTPKGMVM